MLLIEMHGGAVLLKSQRIVKKDPGDEGHLASPMTEMIKNGNGGKLWNQMIESNVLGDVAHLEILMTGRKNHGHEGKLSSQMIARKGQGDEAVLGNPMTEKSADHGDVVVKRRVASHFEIQPGIHLGMYLGMNLVKYLVEGGN